MNSNAVGVNIAGNVVNYNTDVATETKTYTDVNGETAIIPAGFEVSQIEGEKYSKKWISCNRWQRERICMDTMFRNKWNNIRKNR